MCVLLVRTEAGVMHSNRPQLPCTPRRLRRTKPTATYDQNVVIIPIPGSSIWCLLFMIESILDNTRPGVRNITRDSPKVTPDTSSPFPDPPHPILAHAKHKIAVCRSESYLHLPIRLLKLSKTTILSNTPVGTPIVL